MHLSFFPSHFVLNMKNWLQSNLVQHSELTFPDNLSVAETTGHTLKGGGGGGNSL